MSTSTSDHDMSDCSSSPNSYFRYSPHSSPSQQVPQLASELTELTCADNKQQFFRNASRPCLRITEQPQNHFRFRYVSEMVGTHGCLLGKTVGPNKQKTHPTVELLNYNGKALIRCCLAQHNNVAEHPHKLLEDEQDKDMSYPVPDQGSYKVGFAGIGIIHTAKKDVAALLFKKFTERNKNSNINMNLKNVQVQCENMAKSINLNIVRLKFSAHDRATGKEICEPVFSEPIHNMKSAATNDLKICRISRSSGSASGGEDVFILVEKVNKKNIMIRFFELDDNGERGWSSVGQFMQSDVHHQYAIVFRTPPYKNPETPVDVQVFIELVRPSDGRTSEPKEFKYKANQAYKQSKKRKAGSSYCSIGSSSSGSLKSGCDIPISVANHQAEEAIERVPEPSYALPQVHGPISPNQCDLASALYSGSEISQSPVSSPMWSSPGLILPEAPIQDLHIDSMELEQMQIPNNAPQNPVSDDLKSLLNEYLKSYGESLPEEKNSMEFIRSMLVADSGRAQPQPKPKPPVMNRFQEDRSTNQNKVSDNMMQKSEYPAFYKPEDGVEVKKLVKDLCGMIRNKEGYKKAEVRASLERLFEIRLSNGDTFLHMTLCTKISTLEYIVKIIHSVKATHLLDCSNDMQQTTLHLAVLMDKPNIVSLFIAKGANPMLKDDKDLNVIHYAVKYRSCLEILLDSIKKNEVTCDLNDYNGEKQTALHMAVVSGWELGTRLLLQHGASFSVRDAEGRTPLHLAAYDDRLAVMKILLEFIPTSEIDVMDDAGNTALQIICGGTVRENSVEIARMLLEKKAYPLKHEDSNESAWRLVSKKPELRDLMKAYVTVEYMDEDDIKSEPEDEYESADDGDYPEVGLHELNLYAREVSVLVDLAGAWRVLAQRLRLDALLEWYAAQPSPTFTLLNHLKESRDDITSKSLAMILEDIGQTDAASVIRRYID